MWISYKTKNNQNPVTEDVLYLVPAVQGSASGSLASLQMKENLPQNAILSIEVCHTESRYRGRGRTDDISDTKIWKSPCHCRGRYLIQRASFMLLEYPDFAPQ